MKGESVMTDNESIVVRLAMELGGQRNQHFDAPGSLRLFVNMEEFEPVTYPPNTFYEATPSGEHGIKLVPLPVRLESGYTIATDAFAVAEKLGVVPFRPPHIIARVNEGLFTRDSRGYAVRVDLSLEEYVCINAYVPIEAGAIVRAYAAGTSSHIRLEVVDGSEPEYDFDSLKALAQHAVNDTDNFGSLRPGRFNQKRVYLRNTGGIRCQNREGKYRELVTVDGEVEGTITHLIIFSGSEGGSLPIKDNTAVFVRAAKDPNTYHVFPILHERPAVEAVVKDWAKLPALFGRQPKGAKNPANLPESGNVRLVRREAPATA